MKAKYAKATVDTLALLRDGAGMNEANCTKPCIETVSDGAYFEIKFKQLDLFLPPSINSGPLKNTRIPE